MLLRTRITFLLSIALILVIASLVGLGYIRSQLEQDRLADIAIDSQRSLWSSLVRARADSLNTDAAELSARLSVAAPDLAASSVVRVLQNSPDLVPNDVTVQVLGLDGELIASNAPLFRSRSLLGTTAIELLTTGVASLQGLRQERPDRYVVLAARGITVSGTPRAVVSVAIDAQTVIDSLSELIGGPAYLVSLRGRVIAGSDFDLWEAAGPELPRRSAGAEFLAADGRSYFAAGSPVEDVTGGIAGTLVTLRDATDSLAASRRVEQRGFIIIAAFSIVMVAGLYIFLRQAFDPLEAAISTLGALSQGDLTQNPEPGGAGEIRRIGESLVIFRRNALKLVEQEQGIARQRRRQERVIRRQLERLAGTLDPEGHAEVLADLKAVMAEPGAEGATQHRPNEDLAILAEVLQRMSQRITDQHHRLTELIKELQGAIITRARLAALEQELDIARELQLSFLPRPLPAHPAFAIDGVMETAKEVGGDFFDYFMIDENRLGLVVADVSGKGIPAALFMAISRTLIKATALKSASPAATITEVNTFLAADNEQMMFVTVFHGVLDLATGRLTYVNAGHNPPYLAGAEGAVRPLPRTGDPALAIMEDFPFSETHVTMTPGDLLFLFTDGATEAFNVAGEAFGEARIEAEVARSRGETVDIVAERVRDAVLEFERGADRADDLTCVALRYFKGG
ncbi:PP2C family protein-serine/threonine phosphatase [Acuticoccus sp. M5D2P5]|uniref:PP2C family protein-serine/threonine phosphatase n=1 Tax=Acuticoccus kalidii TaxID=2910977 RepID=UPI001F3EF0D0|nr:PP2C family protein-serine/threonine phosphatase [Acuticoccus kalidii]MCF3935666.1 PP2C family protein-serine/threonine phosphatase [Acuticoccus kalidii]